jgi:hypothetical protein
VKKMVKKKKLLVQPQVLNVKDEGKEIGLTYDNEYGEELIEAIKSEEEKEERNIDHSKFWNDWN